MGSFEDILKVHTEEVIDFDRDLNLKKGDSPSITREFKPRISYDLLSFKDNEEICFTNSCFVKEDFHIYFEKMIEVSKTKLGDLMDGNTELDFKIYSGVNKALKSIFLSSLGERGYVETIPSFGRIGLYNSSDGSGKAPRIFFALGHQSTLHILACDPEHKVYNSK
ncbi:hypothetical protein [Thalassobellus citreus]|uniref:hypothetical protein n=1 Tax=Thalassobellus citreus TaxID=3367752 RepID=UPI003796FBC9